MVVIGKNGGLFNESFFRGIRFVDLATLLEKGRLRTDFSNRATHTRRPAQNQPQEIFGKTITIESPSDPEALYCLANEQAVRMFDLLESKGHLTDEIIFNGSTSKSILQTLVDETIQNSVEATARRWRDSQNVGAEVSVLAFAEGDQLWIQVLDNGNGFSADSLERVNYESHSGRRLGQAGEFVFEDSLRNHLYKMGQLATLLDWDLVIRNRETDGGNVSIGIPLHLGVLP